MADMVKNKTGLKKFISENKSLAVSLPILIILVVVVIIVYSNLGKAKDSEDVPAAVQTAQNDESINKVEVLPQKERVTETQKPEDAEIKIDPFAGPMKLSGIVFNKSGKSSAIIEVSGKTIIVQNDESFGEVYKVKSIDSDNVVITKDEKEVVLKLEKKKIADTGN